MSVLVVGLSHRSAPVRLLEQVAVGVADLPKLLHDLVATPALHECFVLSTCNRVEVYAEVEKFHAGVAEISDLLSRTSGVPLHLLSEHLYVHYEDRAVQHLFSVAGGLDSMVVGESQILGQLRVAYQIAADERAAGRVLHELLQSALRTGKRVHTETGIDAAGVSLVTVGLELGAAAIGPLAGRRGLVVGAGSMSALAAATLRRAGVPDVVVANRSRDNAERLAASVDGRGVGLDELPAALAAADVVVAATGATEVVLGADLVEQALRSRAQRPIFVLDLGLPRDVDPGVAELPGAHLVDLEALRGPLATAEVGADVERAHGIVAEEVGAFLAWQRSVKVAPTVVALRTRAAEVVDAELLRLAGRLPDLDPATRFEVATTVRRVVDKLLHTPTVRVKQLAEGPGGDTYADALRELFGLDPGAAAAMSVADVRLEQTAYDGGRR